MPHRRIVCRRLLGASAVGALLTLGLAACGSSGPSVSSGATGPSTTSSAVTTVPTTAPTTTSTSAPATSPTTAVPAGLQLITYHGAAFEVPATWPKTDLSATPNACIRYDTNAVFLGQPGPTPQCPARILGRTETVQVEPLNATSQSDAAAATQAQTINGLRALVDPNSGTARAFTVVFPDQSLVAIVTFRDSPVLASQILQSFRAA